MTIIDRMQAAFENGNDFNIMQTDMNELHALVKRSVQPTPRTSPMTIDEIKQTRNEDNYVDGIVAVALCDIIDNNLAGFLDILSEKLVGSPLLMDVNYDVVGTVADYGILIRVVGDVSSILDMEDDDEN